MLETYTKSSRVDFVSSSLNLNFVLFKYNWNSCYSLEPIIIEKNSQVRLRYSVLFIF